MGIESDVRAGWHDAIIEMFEIDLSTMMDGPGGSFFFTKEILPDGTKVRWKGQVYEPFPIEATGFELTSQGQIPQPELTVANVLGTLGSVVNSADDLVGAKVIRRRTLFKYLDNGPSPDSDQEFPEDIYYIERKTAETNLTITWNLSSRIDLEGLQLPKRIITQNYCLWRYRGPECGYAGPPVATAFDGPLSASSGAGQSYIDAVAAFNEAEAALRTAEDKLAAAQNIKELTCNTEVITQGEEKFNLKRANDDPNDTSTKYTFYLDEPGAYFAAYEDNELLPARKFVTSFGEAAVDKYIPGETQNTGKGPGPGNNGTGRIFAINSFVIEEKPGENPGDPPIKVVVLDETLYDPPKTFGFFDLTRGAGPRGLGFPVIIIDGTIRVAGPIKLNTGPGETPSVEDFGEGQTQAFALGDKERDGVYPVRSIRKFIIDDSQCEAATNRVEAAQEELEAAQEAFDAAEAAVQAAAAALPDNDDLFSQDQCGKRLTSCRLRFPNSTLPFGAFPGASLPR